MHANFTALVALVLSLGAFAMVYRWSNAQPVKVRLGVLLVFTLCSVPSFLFVAYYLHVVPERAWFYTLHAWRGAEFLVIFAGGAAGCAASFLPRILLAFPLFLLIAAATVPYLKPLLAPLPDGALGDHWKGDACLQSTSSTCGPASICTILKSMGIPATEREAALACYSYGGGTEAWYLARYVGSKGGTALFDFRKSFAPEVGLPALVGVHIGGVGHFIAVLSVRGDEVRFADPLVGEETLSLEKFRKRYQFTGFHMSVARN
ncbi:hypothetical protein BH09VER1_BH09VER1_51560 [soil metagenome]